MARRRAVDVLRRNLRYRQLLVDAAAWPADQPPLHDAVDDRLRLVFTCCHPALAPPAQVALTLRTVCGLSTAEIAGAFLVSEQAIGQRLTRARRKISAAGIPYRMPADDDLAERLSAVLAVVYLMFNEGYLTSGGDLPQRRDLTDDAAWLAHLLAELMPTEPEVLGLWALIRLHRARARARFDDRGRLVLLRDQERRLWDHAEIAAAAAVVVRASRLRRPGPYQIQAAIVACHAEAASWETTDWLQILLLYDALLAHTPSPVIRLHRAVAVGQVQGAQAALDELDDLADVLDGYHLLHATRAELLRQLGRPVQARRADEHALAPDRQPGRTGAAGTTSRLTSDRLAPDPPTKGDEGGGNRRGRDPSPDPRRLPGCRMKPARRSPDHSRPERRSGHSRAITVGQESTAARRESGGLS